MARTLAEQCLAHIGETVTIKGWVDTIRDHGKVTFIDLRDRSGLIQVVLTPEVYDKSQLHISSEAIVSVTGPVNKRPDSMINDQLTTGTIELEAKSVELLNPTRAIPFPIDTDGYDIDEKVRLEYRYLDLRRSRLNRVLKLRSHLYQAFRQALTEREFLEIETPMLTKSTKEGARDFIVPSRFYPGKYYALPQSPQQYKQLLMTAGVERYFQMARCIRDEDLRADRGFEFTQLDLEMSFADQQEVMDTVETVVKQAVAQVGGKLQANPFPVFTYTQAIEKFGQDKFDLRSQEEASQGVLAFAWVVDFPFFKEVDKDDAAEVQDGRSGWTFTHNPFSAPQPGSLDKHMKGEDLSHILTAQYDLVCNGYEVGGGSIRAHDPAILRQTFSIMGYTDEQIEESIGHMLKAFELGTPPHGGIALGMDRLVMLLAGEKSLKETIAFPMSSTGKTAVMDAPTSVSPKQLAELGLVNGSIDESLPVEKQIHQKLKNLGVEYQTLKHESVITSAEAASARGSQEGQGAKALVMKADDHMIMVVVPGDKKADTKKLKAALKVKDLEMADKTEVETITKCQIGGVPPLGSLFGLPTYIDDSFDRFKVVYFNAGVRDASIELKLEDLIRVEQPEIISCAKD